MTIRTADTLGVGQFSAGKSTVTVSQDGMTGRLGQGAIASSEIVWAKDIRNKLPHPRGGFWIRPPSPAAGLYVAYNVCASIRDALYAGTAPHTSRSTWLQHMLRL